MQKTCTKCRVSKELSDFYLKRKKAASTCKECDRAYKKKIRSTDKHKAYIKKYNVEWRSRNPNYDKNKPTQEKRTLMLKYTYGMTIEEYNARLIDQHSKCAICKIDQSNLKKPLYVDHCHSTKKIRGLLCHNCNVSLGLLKDSTLTVEAMLAYLKRFKA